MSNAPTIRRKERLMTDERTLAALQSAFCGRLATIGADGWPYCLPLLFVVIGGEVYVHNTSDRGHLRANVDHDARVCFEIDEPGEVFDYGRFECDSGLEYRSVILFGTIRVVDDRATKQTFCEALMQKYGKPDTGRPKAFFPRLDVISVYAIAVDRMTGKESPLPAVAEQWPAKDRTKTPHARAPADRAAPPGPPRGRRQ